MARGIPRVMWLQQCHVKQKVLSAGFEAEMLFAMTLCSDWLQSHENITGNSLHEQPKIRLRSKTTAFLNN